MCKKISVIFLALMISLSLGGCKRPFSDRDMDIYKKIHENYNKMESYSADVDITVFSNKTENRYFVGQKYQSPDKYYTRVTDEDGTFSVTTVTNSGKTKTMADGSDYTLVVPSQEYLSLLFVNNFFRAYYSSEETSLTVDSNAFASDKTLLTVNVEENEQCISKAVLSVDNKTLMPHYLVAYDVDGRELFSARYENFKFNDKIDKTIFDIK